MPEAAGQGLRSKMGEARSAVIHHQHWNIYERNTSNSRCLS